MVQVERRDEKVAFAVISLAVIILSFNAFLRPHTLYQSFWTNWVWADQFVDQLRAGYLYPRWLPLSHGGLGAPVFYYYPPLSFYVAGLLGLAGMPTYFAVLGAFSIALWLSGLAMYRWLKGWTVHPLLASLFYMAAPYHIFDFYRRGALAEMMAIAFIPLVALGLKRVSDGRSGTIAAISFAAMILSHLPLALLALVFLVIPYSLFLTRGRPSPLIRLIIPICTGVALSAVYIVPALALESYRDGAHLWEEAQLVPSSWGLFFSGSGVPRVFAALILGTTLSIMLGSAIIAFKWRAGWSLYAIACCIVILGLIPGFWSLPLIKQVQFPFRAIPFAEFGLATALALVPRREFVGLIAVVPALLLSIAFNGPHLEKEAPTVAFLARHHPDALEYLPRGVASVDWNADWNLNMLDGRSSPPSVAGRTIEPVFYFPAWEILCHGKSVKTFADPQTKLLSYFGTHCERRLAKTSAEIVGFAITFLTLASLILSFFWSRLNRNASKRALHPGHEMSQG